MSKNKQKSSHYEPTVFHRKNVLGIHCLYVGIADFHIIESHEDNDNVSYMIIDAGIKKRNAAFNKDFLDKITHGYFRQFLNKENYEKFVKPIKGTELSSKLPDIYEIPLKAVAITHIHEDHDLLVAQYIRTYRPQIVFLPSDHDNYSDQIKILLDFYCRNFDSKSQGNKIVMPPPKNEIINENIKTEGFGNEHFYQFDAIISSELSPEEFTEILHDTLIQFPNFERPNTESDNINNNSLVFKFIYPYDNKSKNVSETYGSALFTGDLMLNGWKNLVDKWGDNVKSTLLKVAHHGSSASNNLNLIESVAPSFALITTNKTISYVINHPKSILPTQRVVIDFLGYLGRNTKSNASNIDVYIELGKKILESLKPAEQEPPSNEITLFSTAEYISTVSDQKNRAPLSHIFSIDQHGKMIVSISNIIIDSKSITDELD